MVDVHPFRAIRFDPESVGEIDQVLAPPYDVISGELQDELYAKHANNIVRIDLNRSEPGDDDGARYLRAQQNLESWLKAGILKKDEAPAIYVLAQTFTGPDGVVRTRTGFFARVRLHTWDEGHVLPHERTLKGPKIDRLNLMRATRTNLSPIFAAYQDPDGAVGKILEHASEGEPLVDAMMDGVRNRLWAITDDAVVHRLSGSFAAKKLYIADGHHRYETGLAYRNERRIEGKAHVSDPGFEHILTFSAAVEDPGMVIFGTHRLAHSIEDFDEHEVVDALSRFFTVSEADSLSTESLAAAGAGGKTAFGMVTQGKTRLLVARDDAPWSEVKVLPEHAALKDLDVAILHAVVFEHVLGVDREAQASQANLGYSQAFAEALEAPMKDDAVQAAFLMNPTKIEEVIAVAESGEVMPQKSTFFYPKLPSGLVLYPLD